MMLAAPAAAKDKDKAEAVATESIVIPTPPAGKGQIVFFRPGGTGFAIGCSVNEKGQKISSLGAGKYFIMVATAAVTNTGSRAKPRTRWRSRSRWTRRNTPLARSRWASLVGRPDIRPATRGDS